MILRDSRKGSVDRQEGRLRSVARIHGKREGGCFSCRKVGEEEARR